MRDCGMDSGFRRPRPWRSTEGFQGLVPRHCSWPAGESRYSTLGGPKVDVWKSGVAQPLDNITHAIPARGKNSFTLRLALTLWTVFASISASDVLAVARLRGCALGDLAAKPRMRGKARSRPAAAATSKFVSWGSFQVAGLPVSSWRTSTSTSPKH